MILYLIRHPRPLIAPGVCYGQLDVDIDDPATLAATLRSQLPVGVPVISSPLQRCLKLAQAIDPACRTDARLKEIAFGDWEGLAWDDIPRLDIDAWAADLMGYCPPGGESAAQMAGRVRDCLGYLKHPGVVLVTHAGVIRQIMAIVQGVPLQDVLDFPVEYGEIILLNYENGMT